MRPNLVANSAITVVSGSSGTVCLLVHFKYKGTSSTKFTALKFVKFCPSVRLKKVDKTQGKGMGNKEGRREDVVRFEYTEGKK